MYTGPKRLTVKPLLGDGQKTRLDVDETANPSLVRHESQYLPSRMGMSRMVDCSLGGICKHDDSREPRVNESFACCNIPDLMVLRDFNGKGILTSTGEEDMTETTEQFSWAPPPRRDGGGVYRAGRKTATPREPRKRKI